jgi:CHRD domain
MDSTPVPPGDLAEGSGDLDRGKGGWGRLCLLSGTLVMVVLLLVFSGCAAAQNAVSPAPTVGGGSSTFVARLMPEGTNANGSGTASLQLNPDQQTICSVIHVTGIELPATAAHIHQGAAGVTGPIIVHLPTPNAQGVSTGCTRAPRSLILAIMQHPAGYYVNVHDTPYPAGAVRGQLGPLTSHT